MKNWVEDEDNFDTYTTKALGQFYESSWPGMAF